MLGDRTDALLALVVVVKAEEVCGAEQLAVVEVATRELSVDGLRRLLLQRTH